MMLFFSVFIKFNLLILNSDDDARNCILLHAKPLPMLNRCLDCAFRARVRARARARCPKLKDTKDLNDTKNRARARARKGSEGRGLFYNGIKLSSNFFLSILVIQIS
jgi:hypothetical protein